MNKNVFRNLSYGVYIISTMDGDRPTGCTANSVMQITSEPATVAISINHDNYTNECIDKNGFFGCSILSAESDPGLIGGFGFRSGKECDKFDNVDYEIHSGVPVVTDSCGYIVCKVIQKMETSTHTVFLGEVVDGDVFKNENPMTYSYYHKVIKGKSPKNAPTYIPEDQEKQEKEQEEIYVCKVCGYEHKGKEPGEDFKCPICGMNKEMFKKKS